MYSLNGKISEKQKQLLAQVTMDIETRVNIRACSTQWNTPEKSIFFIIKKRDCELLVSRILC